ncbi:hypothetical protein JCM19045_895 [Bacillus sp. JCM 19045]|nr:hypothetical protein JCM19045_895 [Bacillus sp. JCM 19045]
MAYVMKVYVIGKEQPVFEAERTGEDLNKVTKAIDSALTDNKVVSFGVIGENEVLISSDNVTHVEVVSLG